MKLHVPEIGQLEEFTIRTYEIDRNKDCTVPSLIKLMHEAAMQNVLRIKLSVWDLEPQGITWVLMRKYLKIKRLPRLGERVQILTHPAGFEKFFTYRDYRIYDSEQNLIAQSSSTWLLMDTIKRRMTRMPNNILSYNEQMPSLENCLERPSREKLVAFERVDYAKAFTVGWYDLDFNEHLNNVFYTQWMLEAFPEEHLRERQLNEFKIEYRVEAQLNDQIVSEIQKLDEDVFLHRLRCGDKELAVAQSEWH